MLDISSNPVASTEGYREKLFAAIPQLMYIDDVGIDGGAKPEMFLEDEDEGEWGGAGGVVSACPCLLSLL